jgi:hypothetical protein
MASKALFLRPNMHLIWNSLTKKDILVAFLHPRYYSFSASSNNLKKALACSFDCSLLAPVIFPCIVPLISVHTWNQLMRGWVLIFREVEVSRMVEISTLMMKAPNITLNPCSHYTTAPLVINPCDMNWPRQEGWSLQAQSRTQVWTKKMQSKLWMND